MYQATLVPMAGRPLTARGDALVASAGRRTQVLGDPRPGFVAFFLAGFSVQRRPCPIGKGGRHLGVGGGVPPEEGLAKLRIAPFRGAVFD